MDKVALDFIIEEVEVLGVLKEGQLLKTSLRM
jgi:hypothetical protein